VPFDALDEMPMPYVPDPDELLKGAAPPEWLIVEAKSLVRSPCFLDRVGMVGMIGRLATAESTTPKATLRRMLRGKETPGDRARQWATSIGDESLDTIAYLFFNRLLVLGEVIHDVAVSARRDRPPSRDLVTWVTLERDLLESVGWVLQRARPRSEVARDVKRSLALTDSNAHQWHVAALIKAPCRRYPVLAAVFWQEPDAWWAQCAD